MHWDTDPGEPIDWEVMARSEILSNKSVETNVGQSMGTTYLTCKRSFMYGVCMYIHTCGQASSRVTPTTRSLEWARSAGRGTL